MNPFARDNFGLTAGREPERCSGTGRLREREGRKRGRVDADTPPWALYINYGGDQLWASNWLTRACTAA